MNKKEEWTKRRIKAQRFVLPEIRETMKDIEKTIADLNGCDKETVLIGIEMYVDERRKETRDNGN